MLDPYRMVVINIIASAILLIAFLVYKYIYPKKTPPYILMLFLLSLLPLISLLRKGSYESGDLTLHAVRTLSFYQILFGEGIRPSWFPQFNSGYGDPHFIFSYFVPYFTGAVLHYIGIPILASIKILLASTYILSGIFMYFFVKHELKSEKAGFTAAIFYLFTPYHLIDIHFRVTIAESISFAFLPLLLLLTSKLITKFNIYNLILTSIIYASLIMTHQAISLGFTAILISFVLIKVIFAKKDRLKKLTPVILSIIFGLGLSAFYWIPIILESKYTQVSLYETLFIFPKLSELIYSQWMHGFLFQGHYGELSFLIGYTQLIVLFLFTLMILFNKISIGKKIGSYFLILSIILIFLILPYSEIIWQNAPLLKYFQFSYRLLVFLCLTISFMAGIIAVNIKRDLLLTLLILCTIFYTGLNWGNRKSLPEINSNFIETQLNTDPDVGNYLEPTSPIWASAKNKNLRDNNERTNIEYKIGSGEIKEIFRSSSRHEYLIKSNEQHNQLIENTLYFPGWNLYINNNFTHYKHDRDGVITFELKKGIHKVVLNFDKTRDRIFAEYISITTGVILIMIFIFKKRLSLFSNNSHIPRRNRNRQSVQSNKNKKIK